MTLRDEVILQHAERQGQTKHLEFALWASLFGFIASLQIYWHFKSFYQHERARMNLNQELLCKTWAIRKVTTFCIQVV